MLRLMSDERYGLRVQGDQRAYLAAQPDGGMDAATIWVHRFYDVAATTLARHPEDFSIERAAEDLFKLIKLVLAKTGAPRVFLVAHSMGGLICRSLVQRVIPDDPVAGGALDAGTAYVERIFTYATPHGGIEFAIGGGTTGEGARRNRRPGRGHLRSGPHVRVPDARSCRVRTTRAEFDPRVMPDNGFPVDRLFCLVGTNAEDYPVALRVVVPRRRRTQRRAGADRQRVRRGCAPSARAPQPQRTARDRELRGGLPESPPLPVR